MRQPGRRGPRLALAQRDLDGDLGAVEELQIRDGARGDEVTLGPAKGVQHRRRTGHDAARDLGALGDLGRALGPAHRLEHLADREVDRPGRRDTSEAELIDARPRGEVHRRRVPPVPDLVGDEGEERREEALEHRQRQRERGAGRAGGGAVVLAVRADLHELDVVVTERPEERFDALEGARVVVAVERHGGLAGELAEQRQQVLVDWLGDVRRRGRRSPLEAAEHEL